MAGKTNKPRTKTVRTSKAGKAEKAALKAEIDHLKNSREYPELIGLLASAPYKALANTEWLNDRLPSGESKLEKVLKKDKDRFVLAVIRNGTARQVIDDLKDAPSQKWRKFMVEISKLNPQKAEAQVKALKPKEFAAVCELYGIEPVRSGAKKTISKPKTIPRVLAKLENVREHLKL
jgi:hypothetical protein